MRYIPQIVAGDNNTFMDSIALIGLGVASYEMTYTVQSNDDGANVLAPRLIVESNIIPNGNEVLRLNPSSMTSSATLVQDNKFKENNVLVLKRSGNITGKTGKDLKDYYDKNLNEMFALATRLLKNPKVFMTMSTGLSTVFSDTDIVFMATGKLKTTQTRNYNPRTDIPVGINFQVYSENQNFIGE